jgi:hypothetical protein
MKDKEIADRLRGLVIRLRNEGKYQTADHIEELADEIYPPTPTPEPGEVVWVRWKYNHEYGWQLAEVDENGGVDLFGTVGVFPLEELEWKPAHILADDEVPVKIPPTHTWGPMATDLEIVLRYWDVQANDQEERAHLITRAEAEERER